MTRKTRAFRGGLIVVGVLGLGWILLATRKHMDIRPSHITKVEYVRQGKDKYDEPVELPRVERDEVVQALSDAPRHYVLFKQGGVCGYLMLHYDDGTSMSLMLYGDDLVRIKPDDWGNSKDKNFYAPNINIPGYLDARIAAPATVTQPK